MITLTSILLFAPVMLSQIDQSFAITIKSLIDFKVFTFDKTEKKNTSQKENYTTHTFFHHIENISYMLTYRGDTAWLLLCNC